MGPLGAAGAAGATCSACQVRVCLPSALRRSPCQTINHGTASSPIKSPYKVNKSPLNLAVCLVIKMIYILKRFSSWADKKQLVDRVSAGPPSGGPLVDLHPDPCVGPELQGRHGLGDLSPGRHCEVSGPQGGRGRAHARPALLCRPCLRCRAHRGSQVRGASVPDTQLGSHPI